MLLTGRMPVLLAKEDPMTRERTALFLMLAMAFTLSSCGGAPVAPARPDALAARPAPVAPAASAGEELAATVNGKPIRMAELRELLVKGRGAEAFAQLTVSAIVEQAAESEGVVVADADIEAETNETLREYVPSVEPAQHETVLSRILAEAKLPRVYWDMTMRRNAILRKLAAKKLVITDKMLTAEYNRQYGEKVSIRHIQCASLADAQKMLDRIAKGEDFAQLARDFSINKQTAPQGGLIPPFSRDDEAAALVIRDIAFGLADGKVSEIVQVDKHFHILKREKTIPPTEAPPFESVKEELRKRLAAANIRPMQTRLLRDLHNAADLRVIDPLLKETTAQEAAKAVGD